jgi:hypothetical protein
VSITCLVANVKLVILPVSESIQKFIQNNLILSANKHPQKAIYKVVKPFRITQCYFLHPVLKL